MIILSNSDLSFSRLAIAYIVIYSIVYSDSSEYTVFANMKHEHLYNLLLPTRALVSLSFFSVSTPEKYTVNRYRTDLVTGVRVIRNMSINLFYGVTWEIFTQGKESEPPMLHNLYITKRKFESLFGTFCLERDSNSSLKF